MVCAIWASCRPLLADNDEPGNYMFPSKFGSNNNINYGRSRSSAAFY